VFTNKDVLYEFKLNVPPNTPKERPVEKEVEIHETFITEIGVFHDHGSMNMVQAAVFFGEYQEFPSVKGEWVTGAGYLIKSKVYLRYREAPVRLTLKACSPGTFYDHEVIFYIWTEPKPIEQLVELFRKLYQLWLRFMKAFRIRV